MYLNTQIFFLYFCLDYRDNLHGNSDAMQDVAKCSEGYTGKEEPVFESR